MRFAQYVEQHFERPKLELLSTYYLILSTYYCNPTHPVKLFHEKTYSIQKLAVMAPPAAKRLLLVSHQQLISLIAT